MQGALPQQGLGADRLGRFPSPAAYRDARTRIEDIPHVHDRNAPEYQMTCVMVHDIRQPSVQIGADCWMKSLRMQFSTCCKTIRAHDCDGVGGPSFNINGIIVEADPQVGHKVTHCGKVAGRGWAGRRGQTSSKYLSIHAGNIRCLHGSPIDSSAAYCHTRLIRLSGDNLLTICLNSGG